jgi:hypothetical protein
MQYRLTKEQLLDILAGWNSFLKRRVRLIACGGTAMTLTGVKPSTKDVDFMVPEEKEYQYLIRVLRNLGYKQVTAAGWQREEEIFRFDLFRGNRIHTTELLESPLQEQRHISMMEYSYLYVGILNDYDLIASKLIRGAPVDYDDCLRLAKYRGRDLDIERLETHWHEMIDYEIGEDRIRLHLQTFLERLQENGDNG